MFKRMSALVRRDADTRAQFAVGWRNHAEFISDLPGVRGYLQNHVLDVYPGEDDAPLKADGFVELRFDSPRAMAEAFTSPAAKAMAADEPNFLGHGSGYALTTDDALRPAPDGQKLIVAVVDGPERDVVDLGDFITGAEPLHVDRNDVSNLIAKPNMAPPQPVQTFFHVHFQSADAAHAAAGLVAAEAARLGLSYRVFRVRTVTIV